MYTYFFSQESYLSQGVGTGYTCPVALPCMSHLLLPWYHAVNETSAAARRMAEELQEVSDSSLDAPTAAPTTSAMRGQRMNKIKPNRSESK